MLHTMIRVQGLSTGLLAFYTGPDGHEDAAQARGPRRQVQLAFVGYGEESEHCAVELTTQLKDQEKPYDLGGGFDHLAVGVPDVYGAVRTGHQDRRQGLRARPDR